MEKYLNMDKLYRQFHVEHGYNEIAHQHEMRESYTKLLERSKSSLYEFRVCRARVEGIKATRLFEEFHGKGAVCIWKKEKFTEKEVETKKVGRFKKMIFKIMRDGI